MDLAIIPSFQKKKATLKFSKIFGVSKNNKEAWGLPKSTLSGNSKPIFFGMKENSKLGEMYFVDLNLLIRINGNGENFAKSTHLNVDESWKFLHQNDYQSNLGVSLIRILV